MKVERKLALSALLSSHFAQPALARDAPAASCPGNFQKIDSTTWVSRAQPGWNLGNTLEATPTEGSWNNPPVDFAIFDDIKAAGFKSVRVPVTWATHFVSASPDWSLNSTWLQRVSNVVDAVMERDLQVIINAHEDSVLWADVTAPGANYTAIEEQFYALWYQVGVKLGCKSSLLALEPINEPLGNNQTQYDEINKLNAMFAKALHDSGGHNKDRVVTLVGPGDDFNLTNRYFKPPTNITNPWALQIHYYNPYDFIFSAWGKTIWGSDADKLSMDTDISTVRGNFTKVPILIGEWDPSPVNTETAARWKYFDFFERTAAKHNCSTMLWDNGDAHFDRISRTWRDPVAIDILMNVVAGKTNSLADSTTDPSAPAQNSSAYIFYKTGTPIQDQTLPYIFNGNTLVSIEDSSRQLVLGTDYVVDGSSITYKASYLSQYFSSNATNGELGNVTLTFSSGAKLAAYMIKHDTPTLGATGSSTANISSSTDLSIPITWKGISKPAAVRAVEANGVYLEFPWTKWLGPLQQARMTYTSQWDWGADFVTLTAAAIQDVIAAGQTTTFTFEFYPRQPGNAVNYTLTV